MGINANISFETTDGERPLLKLPDGFWFDVNKEKNGRFYIATIHRYYNRGYNRGNWAAISSVLCHLLQYKDVKKVWYYPDYIEDYSKIPEGFSWNGWDGQNPFTFATMKKINKYYAKNQSSSK